ncbi:MAG: molybdopterin-dependent oxidoreductase [Pseudomonadota bacterium]
MAVHKSYCRICAASCGVQINVQDNKIVEIKGDPDHPVSNGYMCIKGRYSRELHNGEDRLLGAKKRGADGAFADIGSMAAIEEVAGKLTGILAEHGPRSVGLYYGTGTCFNGLSYGMARTWLAGMGSPEHYSSFTVDQSAKWVCLGRMGLFATGKPFIEDLDVMLIAGNNPVVSHLGYPLAPMPMADSLRWIKEARGRGAKLIIIDPRRTETARQADLFLQIRPGQDAVLFAAMIRLILERGWADRAFCDRFVTSVDRLRAAVADFDLEFAAARTGIPGEQIVAAAQMFGTARRRSASSGTGNNMAANSNLNEHLLECLNALCGGYRRAGDPIRATGAIFETVPLRETVVPPRRDWEAGPQLRTAESGQLNAEFPTSRMPGEILHAGEDRLRALVVFGGNPATAIADTARTVEALKSLELLVVIDPRMSATARLADYVIPTKLPYERQDLTITQDNWFPFDFVQYSDAILDPPPGVMDDWEVFWELGRLMDLPMDFRTGPYGMSIDRGRLDPATKPTTMDMLELACRDTRVAPRDLAAGSAARIVAEPRIVLPADADDGARLDVCPPDVEAEIRALRASSSGMDGFAYLLTSRRAVHTLNSAFQHAGTVEARHPVAPLFVHPDDIARDGLIVGDLVDVHSRTGSVVGQLAADAAMMRGVASMPGMWGNADPGGGRSCLTNALISLDEDIQAINFMPRQSGIAVNIVARSSAVQAAAAEGRAEMAQP